MKRKICFRVIFAILVIGIMVAVFLLSSQSGGDSNHLSKGILEQIFEFLNFNVDSSKLDQYNLVLRKIAEEKGKELTVLRGNIRKMGYINELKYSFALSLLFCILFAATDEYHQFLLGTRNGSLLDVLLDSLGGLMSIITIGIWMLMRKLKLYFKIKSCNSLKKENF